MLINSIKTITLSLTLLFSSSAYSDDAPNIEELQQILVFDQTCIIMHKEGRKYIKNKEKIAQSHGASAIIDTHMNSQLQIYSEQTGYNIDDVRKIVLEKGVNLFKELSEAKPRELVNQCNDLIENIVRTNI